MYSYRNNINITRSDENSVSSDNSENGVDNLYNMSLKYSYSNMKLKELPKTNGKQKRFISLKTKNPGTVEILKVPVEYDYFKLFSLEVYIIPKRDISLYDLNIESHIFELINYLEDPVNKPNIAKFCLKICQNNRLTTIMDKNYNILSIKQCHLSEPTYLQLYITIKTLVNDVIELEQ